MGYREVGLMQVVEVVRRWQAHESGRTIARGTGIARNTVAKYLHEAERLGLTPNGPVPTDAQLLQLARLGETAPPARAAPQAQTLAGHQVQIAAWVADDLQLTRIAELLAQQGVITSYTTLRRFVQQAGLGAAPRDTVRMAPSPAGEVAEFDFGRLGPLVDPTCGAAV